MRETCDFCGRPRRVCLCAVLPKLPLLTATKVTILQHPHETRHKLATVSVLARCLSNCQVFVGRKFRPGTCPLLDECALSASSYSASVAASAHGPQAGVCSTCGQKRIVLLLFPTSTATDLRTWFQSSLHITGSSSSSSVQFKRSSFSSGWDYGGDSSTAAVFETSGPAGKNEEEAELTSSFVSLCLASGCHNQETRGSEEEVMDSNCHRAHIILLIVDGTWQHAKEMVKASLPFLDRFVIPVSLPHDISREGWGMGDSDSILRKEPFAGCVSTMEAIARALAILEPKGHHIETTLLAVLQHMVQLQASHFTPLKPRPLLTKRQKGGKEAKQSTA